MFCFPQRCKGHRKHRCQQSSCGSGVLVSHRVTLMTINGGSKTNIWTRFLVSLLNALSWLVALQEIEFSWFRHKTAPSAERTRKSRFCSVCLWVKKKKKMLFTSQTSTHTVAPSSWVTTVVLMQQWTVEMKRSVHHGKIPSSLTKGVAQSHLIQPQRDLIGKQVWRALH